MRRLGDRVRLFPEADRSCRVQQSYGGFSGQVGGHFRGFEAGTDARQQKEAVKGLRRVSLVLGPLPDGVYVVRAVIDVNSNRARDRNEAFDSVRVVVPGQASLELLAASKELRPISSPGFQPSLNPFDQERVGKVCTYLNEHLSEPVFREDLARLLNLSPDAFGRFFRSRTGKTLPAFVNHLRVGRACRLLVETDLPVIDVAMRCGFENLSNFNRQFLRLVKRNPREYRLQMGKMMEGG